jgi:hypothetical protein
MNKPIFIPLMANYYEAFEAGTKTHEYRPLGPRWNFRTCTVGRDAVLSYGYGKQRRMNKKIISVKVVPAPADFMKIYGDGRECLAIELG